MPLPTALGALAVAGGAKSLWDSFRGPKKQGQDLRNFQEQAYPNTTPWERLGASSGGAQTQASASRSNVQAQIASSERIAKLQTTSQQEIAKLEAMATLAREAMSQGNDPQSLGRASSLMQTVDPNFNIPDVSSNFSQPTHNKWSLQDRTVAAMEAGAITNRERLDIDRTTNNLRAAAVALDARIHNERFPVERQLSEARAFFARVQGEMHRLGFSGAELRGLQNLIDDEGGFNEFMGMDSVGVIGTIGVARGLQNLLGGILTARMRNRGMNYEDWSETTTERTPTGSTTQRTGGRRPR